MVWCGVTTFVLPSFNKIIICCIFLHLLYQNMLFLKVELYIPETQQAEHVNNNGKVVVLFLILREHKPIKYIINAS